MVDFLIVCRIEYTAIGPPKFDRANVLTDRPCAEQVFEVRDQDRVNRVLVEISLLDKGRNKGFEIKSSNPASSSEHGAFNPIGSPERKARHQHNHDR
ncbi:hypothetical protein D3C87_1404630 [compost metagenome]